LDLPEGTVASRLARARAMLAKRLARHGIGLASASTALVLSQNTPACVPIALVESTVKSAMLFATSQTAVAGVIPAEGLARTKGVLKSMVLTKLTIAATVLTATALTGVGLCLAVNGAAATTQPESAQQATPDLRR